MKQAAVIGAGLVGLSVAYKLQKRFPGLSVHVFEKEDRHGRHQSGRNSGVLHCGLHYQPGSLKARLAVEGIREMVQFCRTHGVAHEVCGKIAVATTPEQEPALLELASRGQRNGLSGLQFLDRHQLLKREPHVRATKALLVPEEGIVSYPGVMDALADSIREGGGQLHYNARIASVHTGKDGRTVIQTDRLPLEADLVVACAGLHADTVYTQLTGKKSPVRIVPFRGEYYHLIPEAHHLVHHLIYPTPDPKYPFLGVHFTRMIDGHKEVGPNAVLALKREGYQKGAFALKDAFDALSYPGLLRFVGRNTRFALGEWYSSQSKNAFLAKARQLIPDIEASMLVPGNSGVRAQAVSPDGTLVMDFVVERFGNQIHVLNAPSPGATASLRIADYILDAYIQG